MAKKNGLVSSKILCEAVVAGMKEKKAQEIVVVDLNSINNSIADFFIVCSGSSDRQIEAIAASVEALVCKELDESPLHIEGKENLEWVLLDYFNVVAHVFSKEKRRYYALESLWGDAVAKIAV